MVFKSVTVCVVVMLVLSSACNVLNAFVIGAGPVVDSLCIAEVTSFVMVLIMVVAVAVITDDLVLSKVVDFMGVFWGVALSGVVVRLEVVVGGEVISLSIWK